MWVSGHGNASGVREHREAARRCESEMSRFDANVATAAARSALPAFGCVDPVKVSGEHFWVTGVSVEFSLPAGNGERNWEFVSWT